MSHTCLFFWKFWFLNLGNYNCSSNKISTKTKMGKKPMHIAMSDGFNYIYGELNISVRYQKNSYMT